MYTCHSQRTCTDMHPASTVYITFTLGVAVWCVFSESGPMLTTRIHRYSVPQSAFLTYASVFSKLLNLSLKKESFRHGKNMLETGVRSLHQALFSVFYRHWYSSYNKPRRQVLYCPVFHTGKLRPGGVWCQLRTHVESTFRTAPPWLLAPMETSHISCRLSSRRVSELPCWPPTEALLGAETKPEKCFVKMFCCGTSSPGFRIDLFHSVSAFSGLLLSEDWATWVFILFELFANVLYSLHVGAGEVFLRWAENCWLIMMMLL